MDALFAAARSLGGHTLLLSADTAARLAPSGFPGAFRECVAAAGFRAVLSAVPPTGYVHVTASTGAPVATFAVAVKERGRTEQVERLNGPAIARADRLPAMPPSQRDWRWVSVPEHTDASSLAALVRLSAAGEEFFDSVRGATGMRVDGIALTLQLARDAVAGLSFAATLRDVARGAPLSALYITRDYAYALQYLVECARCAIYEWHRESPDEAAWLTAFRKASAVATDVAQTFPGAAMLPASSRTAPFREGCRDGWGLVLELLTRWMAEHPFWPPDVLVAHPDVLRDTFGPDTRGLRELLRATMWLELVSDASVDGLVVGRRNALPCWSGLDMLPGVDDPRIAGPALDRVTWYDADVVPADDDAQLQHLADALSALPPDDATSTARADELPPAEHWKTALAAQLAGASVPRRLALVAEAVASDPGLRRLGAVPGYPYDVRAVCDAEAGRQRLGEAHGGEVIWVRVVAAAPTRNVWIAEVLTPSVFDQTLHKDACVAIAAHPTAGCRVFGPWPNAHDDAARRQN